MQDAFYSGIFNGTSFSSSMQDSIGFVTNMVENRINSFYESINTIGISGNAASTSGTLSCVDCSGSLVFELPTDTSNNDSGPSDKADK